MKKISVMIFCIALLLFMTSCIQTSHENTTSLCDGEETSVTTSSVTTEALQSPSGTTYPIATVPTYETSLSSEETSNTTVQGELPPVWEYKDVFEEFMLFGNDRGYFYGKKMLEPAELSNMPFVLFRVVGVEDEYEGNFTIYKVQIISFYGIENYDTSKIYRMAWRGHFEKHLYGRPPLEVGNIYGRFLVTSETHLATVSLWQAGLIYDVQELDGKYYLYGYGTDLAKVKCKIPITDPDENSIYKKGKHDKAIAKLNEIGQPLPTFDYKVELEAFYSEFNGKRY